MTQLTALKAFTYLRRQIKPGQSFQANERDARLFIALGRAAPDMEVKTAPAQATAPDKRPRRPRKVAEAAPQLVTDDPQPEPAAAPEPAPGLFGQHYATRHLSADPQ